VTFELFLAGVEQNGEVFRENKGTSCALALIRYSTPRRMALKVIRQLILLEGKTEPRASRHFVGNFPPFFQLLTW